MGEVDGTVQATAYLAAACRAAENRRPAPRLRDELAALFEPHPGPPGHRALLDAGGDEVVTRAALVDELLTAQVAAGAPPVVVNLGAGFCTRPYRLDLSGCRLLLELDAAEVLAVKRRVLAGHRPSCPVERVAVDLRNRAGLAAALADHVGDGDRVVVVSEGLLPYLDEPAVRALAGTLADAAAAVWLTDVVSGWSAARMAQLAGAAGLRVALFGLDSLDPFERAGWTVTDYRILPVPRRGPWPGPAEGHGAGGAYSRQVVDGVLVLARG